MDALEGKQAAAITNIPDKKWKFSEILADHKIRVRWEKVRQYLLFSYYNAVAHTHRYGLHDLYACSYPRMNSSTDIGLGRSFRQYRTDLSWNRETACCVPDTDCADCRHYASSSAVVTARLFRHATNSDTFKAWLDFVHTYLAIWVMGYEKGDNLCNHLVAPPGHEVF